MTICAQIGNICELSDVYVDTALHAKLRTWNRLVNREIVLNK